VTHDVVTTGTSAWPTIRIGNDGLPFISYVKVVDASGSTVNDLMVAHCADAVCTSATITSIDANAAVSGPAPWANGPSGFPMITYRDANSGGRIDLVHCLNAACTSVFGQIVDTGGTGTIANVGDPATLAIATDAGGVAIAYSVVSPSPALKVASCAGACGGFFVQAVVDTGTVGAPSMAVGSDGLPLISYYGNASADLKLAHCLNVFCTATTRTTLSTGSTNSFTSLGIGADGLGVVSYQDHSNQNLEVGHCADLACTSLARSVIDEFGNLGAVGTAITTGSDGLPLVVYSDEANNLKVAHCGDAACTSEMIAPF
jgi:hypothetical protein